MQQNNAKSLYNFTQLSGEGDPLRIVHAIWPWEQLIYLQPRIRLGEWDEQNSLGFWDINRSPNLGCPVGWGWRIHWLLLCKGVRPPPNECLGYDTKQSDCKIPSMLELWGMRSTPSLPSLPGPLWPGVVAPDRALSMG